MSLLKLSADHQGRAVKMFANLLRYCGDAPGMDAPNQVQAVEIAQKLLHQGLKRGELKEELYMQLVKQTRCNPFPASRIRAWDMFNVVASSMPPSKVRGTVQNKKELVQQPIFQDDIFNEDRVPSMIEKVMKW